MLFRREKIFILDFPTLADGRIADFLQFGIIGGKFFVADPSSWAAKPEGDAVHLQKRAEDCVVKLKGIRGLKIKTLKGLADPKNLAKLAKQHKATILTVNPELKQTLTNIPVILLDELYEVLKPAYLPGSEIMVKVLKKGKTIEEGIGYLDGGIKVVIEGGAKYLGKDIWVVVKGSLDTSVGRLIFAQPKYTEIQ
ncbi:MAG: hypothetical protein ABIK93_03460 [candidate division WOR-3 bacterium]